MNIKIAIALGTCFVGAALCAVETNAVLKIFREAAEQGNASAQFELGRFYEEGQRVKQSYAEAAKWYRAAAKQGDSRAKHKLGEFYEKGQGVEQSYAEAAKWYRAAAERGYPLAQDKLRELYKKRQTDGMNGGTSEVVGILVVALVVFVVVLFIALSTLDMRKEKKKQVKHDSSYGEGDYSAPAIGVDSEGEGALEGVESDLLCGADKCSATTTGEDEESKPPLGRDKAFDTSEQEQIRKPWVSFEGRARRSEYWLKAILLGGIEIGAGYGLCFLGICGSLASSEFGGSLIILGVLLILFAIPWVLSVTVRRFHDRNMSGWWVVLYWLFIYGLAFFIPVVSWIVGVVFFVILACMDGTPGQNKYGKNPKEEGSRLLVGDDASVANPNKETDLVPDSLSEEKLSKPSIESRLALIKDLFDRGIISEEEYNKKRATIIAEI